MNFRKLNASLHRDIGYFLSGLIFIYCLSGIALNHVNDWNPDFILQKRTVTLDRTFAREEITPETIEAFTGLVGESEPRLHDFPTPTQVKIYYESGSLLIDFATGNGTYERVQRRPLFYQMNVLHRNSLRGWKWASDVFGLMLIVLTVSGWLILRGRNGVLGRGKWFIAAGMAPPIIAVVLFQLFQE